jgi:hypothetical protein
MCRGVQARTVVWSAALAARSQVVKMDEWHDGAKGWNVEMVTHHEMSMLKSVSGP